MPANSVIAVARKFTRLANHVWQGIREWSGDAAYDRYLKSQTRRHCEQHTVTREQFYLQQLHKRYSRPSRCC